MWPNFKHQVLIAMSLFKPDAEKNLQQTLDAAKSIAARLVTAKTLLAEHHATAKQLARDNADDATLDEAENSIRAAQIRVDTLAAALTETDQQIGQLELELAAVADKRQREAAAFEIEKTAEGFASAAADTVASLRALALHAEAMGRFLPDAAGLHSFALRAKAELPGSIAMLLMLARSYTDAVLAGHNTATLPAPEAPAPTVQPQPAPTARVFTVRDVAWIDAAGTTQTSGRYFDIDLPPETATRALRLGAAVKMDDPVRRRQKGFGTIKPIDPSTCVNLNDSELPVDSTTQPASDPRVVEPLRETSVIINRQRTDPVSLL